MTNKKALNEKLLEAAWLGVTENVLSALSEGATIETGSTKGETALMLASEYDRHDVVQLLLEHGAEIDAKDVFGNTALLWASWNDAPECVRLLMECGADIHVKNNLDQTALSIAKKAERAKVIALLECALEKQQLLNSISPEVAETQASGLHF